MRCWLPAGLEEKVGQIIQADIASITPEDLRTYPLGSILAGGNSAIPTATPTPRPSNGLILPAPFAPPRKSGRALPLMFGIDAVHGHNNVVGATIFPHNIGLGATAIRR